MDGIIIVLKCNNTQHKYKFCSWSSSKTEINHFVIEMIPKKVNRNSTPHRMKNKPIPWTINSIKLPGQFHFDNSKLKSGTTD